MPRYLVIRPYSKELDIPLDPDGIDQGLKVIENNQLDDITWIHSYIGDPENQIFCIYEAPSPEALRRAARRNNLSIDSIIKVRILDPYMYSP